MRLEIAAQTDVGRRKKTNEDHYGIYREDLPGLRFFKEGALLVVADGLGGHMGGEIASKLAVTTLRDMLKEPPPAPEGDPAVSLTILRRMEEWMVKANANIYQTNLDLVKSDRPMGTTLLGALVEPKRVLICNVGDSRCYLFRDGEIIQRTEDHSWVDEQVKAGLMSKAEAEVDSRKNIVTRSIGTQEEVEADSYVWEIQPGDLLLLCTDGLINMVKDSDIRAIIREQLGAAETVSRLVTLANENGGKDNVTVVIGVISPSLPRLLYQRTRWYIKQHGVNLWWALATVAIAGIAFAAGYAVRGLME